MPSLHPLLSGFAPIWALTGIGYLVGRSGLLGPQAEAVLSRFVFHVAMPAALFLMIGRTPLDQFANPSMLAFAAGTALAVGIGALVAHRFFGRPPAERAIGGMAAGYVNSANLGIPVAMQILGDASFAAPVVLFQTLLVTPAVLTVLDTGRAGRRAALTLPLRNPILLAAALGAAVSAGGWHLPAELNRSCELLGGAGVPTALVALGMSLYRPPADRPGTDPAGNGPRGADLQGADLQGTHLRGTHLRGADLRDTDSGRTGREHDDRRRAGRPGRYAEVGVAVAIKTLIQPLGAFAMGAFLLHLPAHQLLTVVLFSALPTAQNVFVYAREYGHATALARDSVLCSTLVSMATLSAVTWALSPSH
ncbi:AEC family transporter [Kitasatospora sp. CM 4170]|uniref:AEC family transporter n=1 Tax=Kitasatospora aburaviensis TaxID=67265 RepID=A0ABW1F0B2_9ACTN|nr:AEC family transporter [Kitasatospora sp. CM 4170]WNM48951.1 AEC family transporter [Kitasatospora sp. CM 4170]